MSTSIAIKTNLPFQLVGRTGSSLALLYSCSQQAVLSRGETSPAHLVVHVADLFRLCWFAFKQEYSSRRCAHEHPVWQHCLNQKMDHNCRMPFCVDAASFSCLKQTSLKYKWGMGSVVHSTRTSHRAAAVKCKTRSLPSQTECQLVLLLFTAVQQ